MQIALNFNHHTYVLSCRAKRNDNVFTRAIGIFAVLLIVFFWGNPARSEEDLEAAIFNLAKQLSTQIVEHEAAKLAVHGFSELNGLETALGDFISEEMVTAFFSVGDFSIVERRELLRVINEQEQYASGIFDSETLSELGKLFGIDVLVTGSITRLAGEIKINARAIDVETGRVIGASSVKVRKDATVDHLLGGASAKSNSNRSAISGLVIQSSDSVFGNSFLKVVPTGVIVQKGSAGIIITTEFQNVSSRTIGISYSSNSGSLFSTTKLGDQMHIQISGLKSLSRSKDVTEIDPGTAVTVVWTLTPKKPPIVGEKLFLRGDFFTLVEGVEEIIKIQLDNIRLR